MLHFSYPWVDSGILLGPNLDKRYGFPSQTLRHYSNSAMGDDRYERRNYNRRTGRDFFEPDRSFGPFVPFEDRSSSFRFPRYHRSSDEFANSYPTCNHSMHRQPKRSPVKPQRECNKSSTPTTFNRKRNYDPFGFFPYPFFDRDSEESDDMQEDECNSTTSDMDMHTMEDQLSNENKPNDSEDDSANRGTAINHSKSFHTEDGKQHRSSLPNNNQTVTSMTSEEGYEAGESSSYSDNDDADKSALDSTDGTNEDEESKAAVSSDCHDEHESQSNLDEEAVDTSSCDEMTEFCTKQLEKVKSLETTVEELALKVETFCGNRGDKEFLHIDESLTRILIELDRIETCGNQQIRDARKLVATFVNNIIDELELRVNSKEDSSS